MSSPIEIPTDMTAQDFDEIATKLSDTVRQTTKTELNIAYGTHERQILDIYLPDVTTSSMPVLIFMHGGFWHLGTKDWMGFMAPAITMLPAIFISMEYQLTPEAKFPQPIDDCRAALKWVCNNISNYGGDANRIFIGGHSAGGHLASMVTLEKDKLADTGLPTDLIKGCFSSSGIYDVVDTRLDRRDIFVSSLEEANEASPLNHLKGNSVPFFISIGENDFPNFRDQFFKMADALKAEHCHVETMDRPGLNHFQASLDNGIADGPWATKVRDWLSR